MVERRLSDGVRIAQLLASELEGHEGRLAGVALADADPDVEPTADGTLAYAVERDGRRLAAAYVHPERVRVEFVDAPARAAEAARERGLRVRPTATDPPRTLVFVEDGAAVKRALRVFEAVI
ncbi:MAG: hypothetical protein ABEH78_01405 [Haloferacaceae archaeon]